MLHRDVTTLPHPSKSQQSNTDNKKSTVTKAVHIDAHHESEENKMAPETFKAPQSAKEVDVRKKSAPNFWGEFCCERKCVKTKTATDQVTPRYYDKKERHMVLPETEAPKTVSVDCRGKVNPEVFDFSEKTIHLPDLNSSHLKVNTYLTKLAINKHIGLLNNSLNQNEIVGDNFRRHSDHIPRTSEKSSKVKSSSSEKHIGENTSRGVDLNLKQRLKDSKSQTLKVDSPKKCIKIDKMVKVMPSLSIKICEESQDKNANTEESNNTKTKRGLETDSSNECESETGIPKSPTLYISGVSICREPSIKVSESSFRSEQKSPKSRSKIAWKDYKDTTSPVIVHVTSPSLSPCSERNVGETMTTSSYSPRSPELYTPSLLRSTTPTSPLKQSHYSNDSLNMMDMPVLPPSHFSDDVFFDEDDPGLMVDCASDSNHCTLRGTVYAGCHGGGIMISNMSTLASLKPDCTILNKTTFKPKKEEALYENIYPQSDQLSFEMSLPNSPNLPKKTIQKAWSARPLMSAQDFAGEDSQVIPNKLKSKSANEPERDREMFHFPKSSTDGALSSVLHVQESNLSSDDFHEALFLLERSPKTRDSKRRKRSKKRDKSDKDGSKKDRVELLKQAEEAACSCIEESKLEKKIEVEIIDNDSPSNEQDEVSSAL